MGNGCSILKANKICLDNSSNVVMEVLDNPEKKEEQKSQNNHDLNNNINHIVFINQKSETELSNNNKLNNNNNLDNNNNNKDLLIKYNSNYKSKHNESSLKDTIKNENFASFTNFLQELDIPFNKSSEQFEVYDMYYITLENKYNEKMLDVINKLRKEPKSFIKDLDNLINKNNEENKILIENDETHENIVFNDINKEINETKNFLKKIRAINNIKFNLNQELFIDINKTYKNSDMSLEQKITKIIVDKKKEIVKKYPKIQFFVNFIKDEKIGIIYLLMNNNKISNFRNVLFDDKYKEFNVSWFKDKKNNFISILCFS